MNDDKNVKNIKRVERFNGRLRNKILIGTLFRKKLTPIIILTVHFC